MNKEKFIIKWTNNPDNDLIKENCLNDLNSVIGEELISLNKEFEQWKKESIKWSIEDFTMRAKDLGEYLITDKQAQLALEDMISHHDAEWGIGWHTLDYNIEKYGIKIEDEYEDPIPENENYDLKDIGDR